MKGFWEIVRALRSRAGFSSARSFQRAWRALSSAHGARDSGACGYKAYCEIEAGRLIPTPALAARLASALAVRPESRQAEAFRGAYLFSMTHSANLARILLRSLSLEETRRPSLAERALSVGRTRRRHVLNAAQKRLVVEHPAARLSLIALHARSGPWTAAELASALGLAAGEASAALRRLASVGLARNRRGAYTCPKADRNIVFPRPTQAELEKMGLSFFGGFPANSWSRRQVVLFRASHDGARRLTRHAARMATAAHALHRRSGEGGIFSVGAFVWRVS